MSEVCNDDISDLELLGRILNETSQINRRGEVKNKAMYPKFKYPDQEPRRENFFSNKLSVVRLCRGHNKGANSWEIHRAKAESFLDRSDNVFRGFLIARASMVKYYGLWIVQDGNEKNPFHAHIVIPDYDVEFTENVSMATEVLPAPIKIKLDRLRKQMKAVFLNPGPKYPPSLINVAPTEPICNICGII